MKMSEKEEKVKKVKESWEDSFPPEATVEVKVDGIPVLKKKGGKSE